MDRHDRVAALRILFKPSPTTSARLLCEQTCYTDKRPHSVEASRNSYSLSYPVSTIVIRFQTCAVRGWKSFSRVQSAFFLIGLLIGPVFIGTIFHTLAWSPSKSHRPVKSTPTAEILVSTAALDGLLLIHAVIKRVLQDKVRIWELGDPKDI